MKKSIKTGKGILENSKIVYEYPKITKARFKKMALSLKDEHFCKVWKETFGESYDDFVEKMLK